MQTVLGRIGRYSNQYTRLRERKVAETAEKIRLHGATDEDDYHTHIPPDDFSWENIANSPDGMFYGFMGCAENFKKLCSTMPPYVNKDSALAGGMYYFLGRLRIGKNEDGGWNPAYDYSHLQPVFNKYDIYHGIGAQHHMCADARIGLALGWGGLIQKIRHYASINNSTQGQRDFYRAEEMAVEGIQSWMVNTIREIDSLILAEKNPWYRKNLMEMKVCNEWLLENPPRTLREACQFLAWYNMAGRSYNRDGAGGQLDELLRPYYERDLQDGAIDDEDAIFYISGLLLADTRYYQIGGPDSNGRDLTSRLSYLVLEACERLNIAANITIRVHDRLDPALFQKGIECLITYKNGWPRFSGDKALCEGFMRNGYSAELARERIAVGCNWMAIPGKEYAMNDCIKINLAKCFEVSMDEMMSDALPKSTERLFTLFDTHVHIAIKAVAKAIDHHLSYQKFNLPEIIINLMCYGTLEKGLDVSDGGVDYYNIGVDGSGIAVVADSFAALEQRVEKERKCSFEQVYGHLKANFAGTEGERYRALLKNSSRYGYGGSIGDHWAQRISTMFAKAVVVDTTPLKNVKMIPGLFSWSYTTRLGKTVGATPNGRKAEEPINHGANPLPGFRADGAATAQSSAIAAIQPGYGNTAPFQLELDPHIVDMQSAAGRIGTLIRSHFELGGTLVNINILDADKIRKAHQDPMLFPDLVVRVTGFTAYFASLSPEFRQLVLDRLLDESL